MNWDLGTSSKRPLLSNRKGPPPSMQQLLFIALGHQHLFLTIISHLKRLVNQVQQLAVHLHFSLAHLRNTLFPASFDLAHELLLVLVVADLLVDEFFPLDLVVFFGIPLQNLGLDILKVLLVVLSGIFFGHLFEEISL